MIIKWSSFFVGEGISFNLDKVISDMHNNENKSIANDLVKISKNNLKAATLLKSNNYTALSIFHLQQSLETLCKALYFLDKRQSLPLGNKEAKALLSTHHFLEMLEKSMILESQEGYARKSLEDINEQENLVLRDSATIVRGALVKSLKCTLIVIHKDELKSKDINGLFEFDPW